MIDTAEFAQMIKPPGSKQPYRLGKVSSLSPSGAPFIKFDGEDEPSEKPYSYLASYNPAVNDRVLLTRGFETYVVLGRIKY